jgi:parallel beta-helix repeat protein
MRRPLFLLSAAILLLILPAAGIAVTGPMEITSPGTYELPSSIWNCNQPVCIQISSEGVILDGMGHTIDGIGDPESVGIAVGGDGSGAIIRNVRIMQFGTGIEFSEDGSVNTSIVRRNTNGIIVRDAAVRIEGTRVSMNAEHGILLENTGTNQIIGNRILDNAIGIGIFYPSLWSVGNTITNNRFNNSENLEFYNTEDEGADIPNLLNATLVSGQNILNGTFLGGNFWATPNQTGFSETCTDANGNGICDAPYEIRTGNIDFLPLTFARG